MFSPEDKAAGRGAAQGRRPGKMRDVRRASVARAGGALLALALATLVGCAGQEGGPPTELPAGPGLMTPVAGVLVTGAARSWLYDGPIYEAHPYYFDGTFNGITQAIPRIADLGVKTLYLMPIWQQPEGFPTDKARHLRNVYRIPDYTQIDPLYGTPEDLKRLVATAHQNGLKVLFDLILNNTPEGSVIFNNGWVHTIRLSDIETRVQSAGARLEQRTVNGQEHVFYGCVQRQGRQLCEVGGMVVGDQVRLLHFPRVEWGFAPDYTNPELIDYVANLGVSYVREYDIDGWRVDAPGDNWNPKLVSGDHSITQLLTRLKLAMASVKPDTVLLCETASVARQADPPPVLDGVCDAAYSQAFYIAVAQGEFPESNPQHLTDLLAAERVGKGGGRVRYLESHDTPRIADLAPGLEKPYLAMIATIPGIPMIQAGQELGATARYGPDLQIDWQGGGTDLWAFYQRVFTIRNGSDALKFGSIENVWRSGDPLYAFLRQAPNEQVVVAINFQDREATAALSLPLRSGATLEDVLNNETFTVDRPQELQITVPGRGVRIMIVR